MRTLIKVRQRHIKAGRKEFSSACPVALAVRESTGKVRYVSENAIGPYPCPRSAQRFITRFDSGKPVKPFNFFLEM